MLSHFYGFNWLMVCVAAVVSGFKKAVSASAAAVVGIGLFLAPMDQVQAQSNQFTGSGMWTVTQVDLDSFSFVVEGSLSMSLSLSYGAQIVPWFHWSGIYGWPGFAIWELVDAGLKKHRSYITSVPTQSNNYFYPGNRSDYYVCKFGPIDWDAPGPFIDEDEGWVEVWVYTGSATSDPSAYVYDSDGGSYAVDLAIDGYVISGPSLD